jgi:hypothetical protein
MMSVMCADHSDHDSFEETVREIAEQIGESVERAMEQIDLDQIAGTMGFDPDRAREWFDTAGSWLRSQVERVGDDVADSASRAESAAHADSADPRGEPTPEPSPIADDPFPSAAPHPLDLATDEQGTALAALDSGRWEVETGSNRLVAHGDGPPPSNALGLVRELRARDWITAEGEVTLAGRRALSRWLDASNSR